MPWFIITGRNEWDDEDTLRVFKADTQEEAMQRFEEELRESLGSNLTDRETYINTIVEVPDGPEPVVHHGDT